jgi:hypothetical protein
MSLGVVRYLDTSLVTPTSSAVEGTLLGAIRFSRAEKACIPQMATAVFLSKTALAQRRENSSNTDRVAVDVGSYLVHGPAGLTVIEAMAVAISARVPNGTTHGMGHGCVQQQRPHRRRRDMKVVSFVA